MNTEEFSNYHELLIPPQSDWIHIQNMFTDVPHFPSFLYLKNALLHWYADGKGCWEFL
jgi:hypothetical protein